MDTGLEGAPEAPDSAVGRGASGSSFVLEGPCGGSACSCLLASPRTGTPPRQPPLPEGPGERIPCRSSDLRAESGGRRGAEPGPLAAGDSEVLKSWTHLVHAWAGAAHSGPHCSQLCAHSHSRVGVCMQSLLAARCAMPLALSRPCHLYPEVSFIAHGRVWGSI